MGQSKLNSSFFSIFLSSLSPSILLLEPKCLWIYREKFLKKDLLIRFGKKISKISASQLVWFFWVFPPQFFQPFSYTGFRYWSHYQLYNYERVLFHFFYFCFYLYFWMTCKQCKYMYFVKMCKNWLCINSVKSYMYLKGHFSLFPIILFCFVFHICT